MLHLDEKVKSMYNHSNKNNSSDLYLCVKYFRFKYFWYFEEWSLHKSVSLYHIQYTGSWEEHNTLNKKVVLKMNITPKYKY